jgi:hypothetical protein
VHTAAETTVIRLVLLTSVFPLSFAAIREHHLAGKQLYAREQEHHECCDPKDRTAVRHGVSVTMMPQYWIAPQ